MARDPRDRLDDILAAISDIEAFVGGLSEQAFLELDRTDTKTYRAVRDCLSVIGEAVKALPDALKNASPEVGWNGYAGMRDVIAHQYFNLELRRIWITITTELPALRAACERARSALPD